MSGKKRPSKVHANICKSEVFKCHGSSFKSYISGDRAYELGLWFTVEVEDRLKYFRFLEMSQKDRLIQTAKLKCMFLYFF